MAKRPVFDFKLEQPPRVRSKAEWLEVAADTRALGAAALENARNLALEHVEPGPWQVRRDFQPGRMAELVESVRAQGVLEPILVRPAAEGRYQIIAGERRYRAAGEAGLTTIPALVLELDDVNARVVSLMENIQRDDLNEVERAEGLVAVKDLTGQTWEDIGRALGITKRHVLHLVSLTRLPADVQALIREGKLSAKHGRLLAYVKDPATQQALAELIVDRRLNALQTAEAVKRLGGEPGFAGAGESGDALRDRVADLVDAIVEPAPEAAATPPIDPTNPEQLLEAAADLRRALEDVTHLSGDTVPHLRTELHRLIEIAGNLAKRLAHA